MDFNEAMRQQDAKERRVSDNSAAEAARQHALTLKYVSDVEQALRDMARYLGEAGAARYQFTYTWKKPGAFSLRHKASPSPVGYILYVKALGPMSKSLGLLQMLCEDGRLWKFSNNSYQPHDPSNYTLGFEELAPVAGSGAIVGMAGKAIKVGSNGDLVAADYGYDNREEDFMQFMTRTAREYLNHGGYKAFDGLSRIG